MKIQSLNSTEIWSIVESLNASIHLIDAGMMHSFAPDERRAELVELKKKLMNEFKRLEEDTTKTKILTKVFSKNADK